jgi:DNA-binding protein H-NS
MDISNLEEMPLDDLWALHESICRLLSTRIIAERGELERRLAQLHGGKVDRGNESAKLATSMGNKVRKRKKYPRVHPKYQNPSAPEETWSGRGKKPLWLVSALKTGKRIEDFRIIDSSNDGIRRLR